MAESCAGHFISRPWIHGVGWKHYVGSKYMGIWVHEHPRACKPAFLDYFAHLPFLKVLVFRVFIFHSFSLFLHHPSLSGWPDSWEIPTPWDITFQKPQLEEKISDKQIYSKLWALGFLNRDKILGMSVMLECKIHNNLLPTFIAPNVCSSRECERGSPLAVDLTGLKTQWINCP